MRRDHCDAILVGDDGALLAGCRRNRRRAWLAAGGAGRVGLAAVTGSAGRIGLPAGGAAWCRVGLAFVVGGAGHTGLAVGRAGLAPVARAPPVGWRRLPTRISPTKDDGRGAGRPWIQWHRGRRWPLAGDPVAALLHSLGPRSVGCARVFSCVVGGSGRTQRREI
jgi:hypothetical protein